MVTKFKACDRSEPYRERKLTHSKHRCDSMSTNFYPTERKIGESCIEKLQILEAGNFKLNDFHKKAIRSAIHLLCEISLLEPGQDVVAGMMLEKIEIPEPFDKVIIPEFVTINADEDHYDFLDREAVHNLTDDRYLDSEVFSGVRDVMRNLRASLDAMGIPFERCVNAKDARRCYSISDERHKDDFCWNNKIHLSANATYFPRIPIPVTTPLFVKEYMAREVNQDILDLFWNGLFDTKDNWRRYHYFKEENHENDNSDREEGSNDSAVRKKSKSSKGNAGKGN